MTTRVGRDRLITVDSADLPSAVVLAAGEAVEVETVRATEAPFLTGPIEVSGLSAGDTLAVTVEEIHLTGPGAIGFAHTRLPWEPWGGVLRSSATAPVLREIEVDDHQVRLTDGVVVPSRLMVGWIGLILRTYEADPWDHGGNLDTPALTSGSTLYLHDSTGSGRFLVGDVHAAMGDGEVSGMGVEVAAELVLRVDVLPGTAPHRPLIATATTVSHLCSRFVEPEAYAQATADAAVHLAYSQRIGFDEANAWLGAIGDLRVSSVVAHAPTYRMDVPRTLLAEPGELLRHAERMQLPISPRGDDRRR